MNPGYLAFILCSIALILCLSGWSRLLLRDVSVRAAIVFLLVWLGASWLPPLTGTVWSLQPGNIVCAALVLPALYRLPGTVAKLHYIAVIALLASASFVLRALYLIDPGLMLASDTFDVPCVLGVLAALLVRGTVAQASILAIGLMAGTWSAAAIELTDMVWIAGAGEQDRWWLAVYCARATSLAGEWIKAWGSRWRPQAKQK